MSLRASLLRLVGLAGALLPRQAWTLSIDSASVVGHSKKLSERRSTLSVFAGSSVTSACH